MSLIGTATRIVACAACILLGACVAPARAPDATSPDVRIERVDKEFDLGRGVTRVAIDNPWGEINIRARDEREVGIHAVIQRMPPRFANAQFRSHREGDTLHIDVAFDGAQPPIGRVDTAIYLPRELALDLHTRGDRISAKKWAAPIAASSESGEIQASSHDRLTLHTVSGQIRAIAIGARWQGASEIVSDSGRIVLLVPTFGDVDLSAETGGRLHTNFGLGVHADPRGRSHADARYGQGASRLSVRSRTGEITLEQLVLLGEDDRDLWDDD